MPFEATIEGVLLKAVPPPTEIETEALLGFSRDIPTGIPNNRVPPMGKWFFSVYATVYIAEAPTV